MIRLFVSLELSDDVRSGIERLCRDVPGARWVEPEQLHLTIRFIGEVEEHVFEDIRQGLARVRLPPFALSFRGVGHFPPRGQPRVLWVGVEPSDDLRLLHGRVESVLTRLGLESERRKFSPHVTLARLRGTPPRVVGSFLSQHGLYRAGPMPVDRFWLFSSLLSTKHAVHRPEAEYPLGDGLE